MTVLRDRLLDAARDVVETSGWGSVTMSRLATTVGVSRQTVHTELGTKHELARSLALRELERFLQVVREAMEGQSDLAEGIRAACQAVLELGESSLLIRSIVTSVPTEQDADLIAILTTESGEIVDAAALVVRQCVDELYPPTPFDDAELDVAIEAVVRIVLSCITRPSQPPAEAAAQIAWIYRLMATGRGA